MGHSLACNVPSESLWSRALLRKDVTTKHRRRTAVFCFPVKTPPQATHAAETLCSRLRGRRPLEAHSPQPDPQPGHKQGLRQSSLTP